MTVTALIDGRPHTFYTEDESQTIGDGGEAVVMKWTPPAEFTRKYGNGRYAVKLFFQETPPQIAAANMRQQKLPRMPINQLRAHAPKAMTPTCFATDPYTHRIIGYVMPLVEHVVPLIKLMDGRYRQHNGITQHMAVKILKNLHSLVQGMHRAGVVIGDFNDKNVLVNLHSLEVFLIDVDSAQWGAWPSLVATAEFTDPLLLDQDESLKRGASYAEANDWYSFAVMVYQLLTLTHPYRDGVHNPERGTGKRQRFPERIHTRITVFDPRVRLGKKGVHRPATLPEELGLYMRDVFVNDKRDTPFPLDLLESFRWMTCPKCNNEHGRYKCPFPNCGAPGFPAPTKAAPRPAASTPQPATPAGSANIPLLNGTPPAIPAAAPQNTVYLAAAYNDGALRYVHHQNGAYLREDGTTVWRRSHENGVTAHIAGTRTVFAAAADVMVFNGSNRPTTTKTQQVLGKTTVSANSRFVYWVSESFLMRDDGQGKNVMIGSVLPGWTSVWAGEQFGVALIQAGAFYQVKVFDAVKTGLEGSAMLPLMPGDTVTDASCIVSDTHAWLMIMYRTPRGVLTRSCFVLDRSGQILATETGIGAKVWMGGAWRAGLAIRDKLLVPVANNGIVRVGISNNTLQQEGAYRNSVPVVGNATQSVGLCLTPRGLLHVGRTKITRVTSF